MTAFPDLLSAAQMLERVAGDFAERAAIREHDGGQDRPEAEIAAMAEALGRALDERQQADAAAREAALHAAEEYCDQIGVYDFREMTESQAVEFTSWLIDAYRVAMAGR